MKKIGVALLCFVLAACGFQPLYMQSSNRGSWYDANNLNSSIIDEMSQIKVMPIAERFGQQLRNDLLDLITPKGVPQQAKYRLAVEPVSKDAVRQAMRNDVTATNERIEYRVNYRLFAGTRELVSGNSIAFISYDILANPYSTTMAQKKGESDAAKIIANDIALRIGAYFHNQKSL